MISCDNAMCKHNDIGKCELEDIVIRGTYTALYVYSYICCSEELLNKKG